jgi:hypothetical protein
MYRHIINTREISQINLFPGLSCFSTPVTKTALHIPDRINEYASNIPLVPELQRFSTFVENLGFRPTISETMLLRYGSNELLDTINPSTSAFWIFDLDNKLTIDLEAISDTV